MSTIALSQSLCADCIHYQGNDCHEPMRDAVGAPWVVPAGDCSGQVTPAEYAQIFGTEPPKTLAEHQALFDETGGQHERTT